MGNFKIYLSKRKGWKGDANCALCRKPESIDRIFFGCPVSQFAWCMISDLVFGRDNFYTSRADFIENGLNWKFGVPRKIRVSSFLYDLLGQSGRLGNRNRMAI